MAHDALEMVKYRSQPPVLIFADLPSAGDRARHTIELAGCRVADCGTIAEGAERLDRQIVADCLWIEAEGDTPALDRLLDRVQLEVAAGRYRAVVVAPPDLIDPVAARTPHPHIGHLCQPTEADRIASLLLASARQPARLQDVGRGEESDVLQQLMADVARMAGTLASLSEADQSKKAERTSGAKSKDEAAVSAGLVRSMIRARRMRDDFFKGGLFADPAWDILLDLLAARLEKRSVAVSSLCIAAAVPPTTALRWIQTLTDRGLLVRIADPRDGRRVYIELSDEAHDALIAYVGAVQRLSPLTV
jgi:DNA-binding transcriptional ArsR family regulator